MSVPLRREHAAHGLDDQLEVRPGGALADVQEVELHPLVEADGVAVAAGLPVAGQPLLAQQALALPGCVLGHLARERRPRADHREIVFQDVNELGELI